MADPAHGTVTFVFADEYGHVSDDKQRLVREALGARDGTEIDTRGDALVFSFPVAQDAVEAAVDAQIALGRARRGGDEVRVRMGVHTGAPHDGGDGDTRSGVARAARIAAAGEGGQILVSNTTRALLGSTLPEGVAMRDLGLRHLQDVQHEHLYELTHTKEEAPESPRRRRLGGAGFGVLLGLIMLLAIALLVRFAFF